VEEDPLNHFKYDNEIIEIKDCVIQFSRISMPKVNHLHIIFYSIELTGIKNERGYFEIPDHKNISQLYVFTRDTNEISLESKLYKIPEEFERISVNVHIDWDNIILPNEFQSGYINVDKSKNMYTFKFEGVNQAGKKVSGYYSGLVKENEVRF
jgi:hypothetical protein